MMAVELFRNVTWSSLPQGWVFIEWVLASAGTHSASLAVMIIALLVTEGRSLGGMGADPLFAGERGLF